MIIKNIEDLLEHLLIWYDTNKEYYSDVQYSELINKFKEEQGFLIKEAKEVVQRERPNEETTYKCEICNKEKKDHEMRIITDVDLISKQYVCQDCLNGIK